MQAVTKIKPASKRDGVVKIDDVAHLVQELRLWVSENSTACQLDGQKTASANPRRFFSFKFATPQGVKTFGLHGDTKRAAIERFLELAGGARRFEDVLELKMTSRKSYKLTLRCPDGDNLGWYSYCPIPGR